MESKHINIKKAIHLSICFLLLFSAFSSVQNIVCQYLINDGLYYTGYIALAVLYFFFGVGTIFANYLVNKIGVKVSLMLGGLFHSLWIFSMVFPSIKVSKGDWDIDHNSLLMK